MKTKLITLKLSETLLYRIEQYIKEGKAKDRTEAVKQALERLLDPTVYTLDTPCIYAEPQTVYTPSPEDTKEQKLAALRALIANASQTPPAALTLTQPEEEQRIYTEYGDEGEKEAIVTASYLLKRYGKAKATAIWNQAQPIH